VRRAVQQSFRCSGVNCSEMKRLATILVFLVAICASNPRAHACTCVPPLSVRREVTGSDIVFQGTILRIRTIRNQLGPPPDRVAVFQISRVWKGDLFAGTVEVRVGGPICQSFPRSLMSVGKDLIVYANRAKDGQYFTTICTRTALAKESSDFRELGSGLSPK